MERPVETTTAGWPGSKTAATTCSHLRSARLEVDRDQPQPLGDPEAQVDRALALPGLDAGLIDLEHR
jgi:hypothetical protein